MNKIKYVVVLLLGWISCNTDKDTIDESLADLVAVNSVKIDNVIACATSSKDQENIIITYLYPRPGATDIRYYETSDVDVDKNEYHNYQRVALDPIDVFNGYLKKMIRTTAKEKWVIITFLENNIVHLSNPIRLKHKSTPTEFTNTVIIDNTTPEHPIFSWEDGLFKDNAIYFQVISDINNTLLSGTYTTEKMFQYYNTTNVILNITNDPPPDLVPSALYNYTLMGVSEDNWVNLFIEEKFIP